MIKKIDHIGIAVINLNDSIKFYTEILGLKLLKTEELKEQKLKIAFIEAGETEFELLEPMDSEGPIAKFIETKGQGIQHIAFRVEDIEKVMNELKSKGIRMIDEKPRSGAGNAKIAFIHPKSTNGVLIELCQR